MKSVMLFLINGEHQHHRNIILDQLILALSVSVLINNKNLKKRKKTHNVNILLWYPYTRKIVVGDLSTTKITVTICNEPAVLLPLKLLLWRQGPTIFKVFKNQSAIGLWLPGVHLAITWNRIAIIWWLLLLWKLLICFYTQKFIVNTTHLQNPGRTSLIYWYS